MVTERKRYRIGGPHLRRPTVRTRDGDEKLASLAEKALEAFREDLDGEYRELVRSYDGSAAAVGVFGLGSVTIAVQNNEATINPPAERRPPLLGRGATYPEVIVAIARGELTVVDALNRGDLMVQVEDTEQLHRAYDFFTRFSEGALRSERLREVLREFESTVG